MSDYPDESKPSNGADSPSPIAEARKKLEQAHRRWQKTQRQSQEALSEVVQSITDLARAIEEHPSSAPIEPEKQGTSAPSSDPPPTPEKRERPETPKVPEPTSDTNPNNLPAELHSRGISIPSPKRDQSPSSSTLAPPSAPDQPPAKPRPRQRRHRIDLDEPTLIEATRPESPSPFPGLDPSSKIVITNDGFGVAPALNEILSQKGLRVRVESRRPELASPADAIIFLGGLRAPRDLDDAMSVIDDAVHTAERMTTRLMQPDSSFICAIDTAASFGLERFDPVAAPLGALVGLVRLLDKRHPGSSTKLVDIDGGRMEGPQIAEILAQELLEGGAQSPIALSNDHRRTVQWASTEPDAHPAKWLTDTPGALLYMPGPSGILATSVERLAIAHELPVALLRRRHVPAELIRRFTDSSIETRKTNYDLNHLFNVMDFLDALRSDFGPISAVITESIPAQNPDDLPRWEVMRPPLDEFNALLAMTINDPLQLLGVGIGPRTPPVITSALRYFSAAESLRRNDSLRVRLAHMESPSPQGQQMMDPRDFALTEFLASAQPLRAEMRIEPPR